MRRLINDCQYSKPVFAYDVQIQAAVMIISIVSAPRCLFNWLAIALTLDDYLLKSIRTALVWMTEHFIVPRVESRCWSKYKSSNSWEVSDTISSTNSYDAEIVVLLLAY